MNLIGYAYGQLGIGEDMRMAAQALLAAGVPVTMVNFPPGKDVPQNDRSMAAHVSDVGPFAINLFCMTAFETGRFFAERGKGQFVGRYNIGYWPWELGKWPKAWRQLVELVDERTTALLKGNRICNTNKHRLLAPMGIGASGMHVRKLIGSGNFSIPTPKWDSDKNEIVFLVVGPNTEVKYDLNISFGVSFNQIETVEGLPTVGVLNGMADKVSVIFERIRAKAFKMGLIT